MISSLIRHSDLSSRHFLSLSSPPSVSPASPSCCLQRVAREIYRWLMHRCMSFGTGFSSQSFPPALFLYPCSLWEEAATRFSSFLFQSFSFFSFCFCKGRRRRRRRRNKTKKPKTTKKKKQVEQESGFRFEVWRRGLARQNRCPSPPSLYF
jgi:hypothetical protein